MFNVDRLLLQKKYLLEIWLEYDSDVKCHPLMFIFFLPNDSLMVFL